MDSTKKNYIYQVVYQIISILLPLITAPYLARIIGKNGVGLYAYTYSIIWYFVLFAKLGIDIYGNRTIATVRDDQNKLNKVFTELFIIHFVVSIIALGVYLFCYFVFLKEYAVIALAQILYIVAELVEVNWLFFGLEKFKLVVSRNTVVKLVTLLLILLFVKNPNDTWIYCIIMAGGALGSEVIVWLWVPRYVKFVKVSFGEVFRHFVPLISFFIPAIAVSFYKVMDKIMLGVIADTDQVGLYENAEKIINMLQGLITALGTVMLPRMSNLAHKGDVGKSEKIILLSMKFIMFATLPLVFGIIGTADVFVPIFYGNDFEECVPLLIGLSLSMPFLTFANVLRTQFLLPNHRDKVYQISLISGSIINLTVNYLFIPKMQAAGAVFGTILAEATVCFIQSWYSRKKLPIISYIKGSIPYLVSGGIMCLIVNFIGRNMSIEIKTLIIQVLVGVLVYGLCSFIYLYRVKDELWCEIVAITKKRKKK